MAPNRIVVSGLPRSGTSMMMRMLEAGGLPVLIDQRRAPDRHNPHGYYEYEPVLRTARDASWLDEASGKVVKVVYRLLADLPDTSTYRVLMMRRPLRCVFDSQEAMLDDSAAGGASPERIDRPSFERVFGRDFERVCTALGERPNVSVLMVDYDALVLSPRSALERVSTFLDEPLDLEAMEAIADPALRHQA